MYRVPTTSVSLSTYNVQASDYYIGINYNGTTIVQLPIGITGATYIIKDESGQLNGTTNVITVSTTAPNTIDSLTQANLVAPHASLTLIFNNQWNLT